MLDQHRGVLLPFARVVLKSDLGAVTDNARAFARRPTAERLTFFRQSINACTRDWPKDDHRHVVISAEDLIGLIPGRRGRVGYPQAAPLLSTFTSTLGDLFPHHGCHVFFSTRTPSDWLRSCHAHHLRHTRCTLDQEAYERAYAAGADLTGAARDIAANLDGVPASTASLGDHPHPAIPLFNLISLPKEMRDKIRPEPPSNISMPNTILTEFLALNRSDLDEQTLVAQKKALLTEYRKAKR
ncbi:MAG: hypothetical protein AAFQ09_06750 [Pseudomonadota bacterium]